MSYYCMSYKHLSPEDRKKVKSAIDEISNSMARMEGEKDLIKETIDDIFEEYKIPKKTLRKMATVYHKQKFHETLEDHEEFETLYENVINITPT